VVAKVDVRGTGSSEGRLIPKEYSDIELDDGMQILSQLSNFPWSNGKIGIIPF
jgi:predicted acyl esterase